MTRISSPSLLAERHDVASAAPPPHRQSSQPEPFRNVEEAWFWTMAALVARRERSPRGVDGTGRPRPAMPEDILRCLDQLYRQRRIDLVHARILRIWGERGMAPDPSRAGQRSDSRIWREAMERLDWSLRVRGIVGEPSEIAPVSA